MSSLLTEVTIFNFLILTLVFIIRNHLLHPLSSPPIPAAPVGIGGCGSEAVSGLLVPLGSLQKPQESVVGKSLGVFPFEEF